jgi:hypothetical protein
MPTQQGFWRNDKMMAPSRLSLFGPTLRLLTEQDGEAVLMSYLEAFPARTLAAPEKEQASKVSDLECGWKWPASFAKYSPESSSWKTRQCSLLGGLEEFSETWPRWGSMRNGECLALKMLVPITSESEFGSLPTPCASDYRGGRTPEAGEKAGRGPKNNFRDFCRQVIGWKYPSPEASEVLMAWHSGWTDLKPLATDKCHDAQLKRSNN